MPICSCNALIPLKIYTPAILRSSPKKVSPSIQTLSQGHCVTCVFMSFYFWSAPYSSTSAAPFDRATQEDYTYLWSSILYPCPPSFPRPLTQQKYSSLFSKKKSHIIIIFIIECTQSTRHRVQWFTGTISLNVTNITIFIIFRGHWMHREIKTLAHVHSPNKWRSWNSSLGSQILIL